VGSSVVVGSRVGSVVFVSSGEGGAGGEVGDWATSIGEEAGVGPADGAQAFRACMLSNMVINIIRLIICLIEISSCGQITITDFVISTQIDYRKYL
jgi:hypothetical protein